MSLFPGRMLTYIKAVLVLLPVTTIILAALGNLAQTVLAAESLDGELFVHDSSVPQLIRHQVWL